MSDDQKRVRGGSFCGPVGALGLSSANTPMVCSIVEGQTRARWRRNGPTPKKSRAKGEQRGASMPPPSTLADARPTNPVTLPTPAPATAPAPAADLDSRIRAAYGELAKGPGDFINLTDLRKKLPDVDKADLDKALTNMLDKDDTRLEPEPFGHRIGQAERDAAVHLGGEDRHKIAIGDPNIAPDPEAEAEPTPAGGMPISEWRPEAGSEAEAMGDAMRRDREANPTFGSPAWAAKQAAAEQPAPGAPQDAPAKATTMPPRTDEELRAPNGEFDRDQGLIHYDGAIGRLWNDLGDERHLQVDGHALGNVLVDLGQGITMRRHDTNHALAEMRRIRQQLPDGSRPAALVDEAINRLHAPERALPEIPEDTPAPLRTLMHDLNNINLVRRGSDGGHGRVFHETDQLADLIRQRRAGTIRRGDFQRGVEDLVRGRHESSEGWEEIKVAVAKAMGSSRDWRRYGG